MKPILKYTALFTLITTLLLCVSSCAREEYGHAELRIELPHEFSKFSAADFDAAYSSGSSVVGIIRISFEAGFNQGIPETFMPREFAEFYMSRLGRDAHIEMHGDIPYYQYAEQKVAQSNIYLAAFYRSKHAYFVLLFASPESEFIEQKPLFLEYASSVWFVS